MHLHLHTAAQNSRIKVSYVKLILPRQIYLNAYIIYT